MKGLINLLINNKSTSSLNEAKEDGGLEGEKATRTNDCWAAS